MIVCSFKNNISLLWLIAICLVQKVIFDLRNNFFIIAKQTIFVPHLS